MTRPATLYEAAERIRFGADPGVALAEFLDTFYIDVSGENRVAMFRQTPPPTGQKRVDALLAAVAEYLSKHYRLAEIPSWVADPARFLDEPWFTAPDGSDSDAMREYLAISSPAEFRHHNIFTEAEPLRRASQRRSDADRG